METRFSGITASKIYPRLGELWRQGKTVALATILETKGSTPQVAGASALITSEGLEAGTLGGGSFEASLIQRSRELLERGESELVSWNFSSDLDEEGSLCGGEALVLVDGSPEKNRDPLEKVVSCLESRGRGVLITRITPALGGKALIERLLWQGDEETKGKNEKKDGLIKNVLSDGEIRAKEFSFILKAERPELLKKESKKGDIFYIFLEPILPPPRLLVFGAGHVGQAVAHLGHFLGFEVFVFDDRPEFGHPSRFEAGTKVVVGDMAQSLENFSADDSSYVVIVTRGHRHDAAVLRAGLKKKVAYIGMIGSRRKVELMRKEFIRQGWATAAEFDRVHAPIGLDIGAQTVEEIAVSIMAEIVARRRLASGKSRGEEILS